jgi:hypothetical protein
MGEAMSGAQEYYDGLLTQGYTPDQAKMYTQQHFPGFEPAAPQVAPMDQFQVDQTQVQDVAQQHGVNPTQLAETARHFDANQDGVLQQSELQATAQQMVSTTAPVAPAAAAPPAAAPMAAPMGGMPAPGMAAPAAAPMGGMPAPGMAAPMGGMPAPGMAAPMGGMPAPGMAAPMGGMMPMPAASGDGGPLGYVAVACIVLTLVFSTWGVLGGTWLVPEEEVEGMEMHASLRSATSTMSIEGVTGMDMTCQEFVDASEEAGVDVEEEMGDYSCDGDNIVITMSFSEGCEDTDDEDACDMASAGLWGTIILWVAVVAGLGATLLIIFNVFGIGALPVNTQQFGMIAGIAAGALAGIGVLMWYILLPSDGDMSAGLNVWLTIVGAVTGIAGGILTKTHGNPSA